jgi:uracil-DNA glycosylase
MTHLVIFGERPGPNTDPDKPLHIHTTTGAAERLRELLGMSKKEYYETSRYNVADDPWTSTASSVARGKVLYRMDKHRAMMQNARFIFLGRAAANAAPRAFRNAEFGVQYGDVMVIPHPSGRNRYYNSQANKLFIEESLRKFLGRS